MSRRNKATRIMILVIVLAFVVSSLGFTGLVIYDATRNKQAAQDTEEIQKQLQEQLAKQQGEVKVESTDIKVGKGKEAAADKEVTVHYTGTLKDGTKFDSSLDRKEPFTFTLGAGQVIQGWDQGVVGMREGGKRKLVIPAALAYGEQSPSPKIPPNSDLVFEIELISVK